MNPRTSTIGIHGAPALELLSRERQARYLIEAEDRRLVHAMRRDRKEEARDGAKRRRGLLALLPLPRSRV